MFIDEQLEKSGGRRVANMGKANAAVSDMFSDLESWEDGELWKGSSDVRDSSATETAQQINITNPRARALHQSAVECTISETRELSKPGCAMKCHVEIQLPPNMTYAPGYHLYILPTNPRQNVHRALARFHLAGDSILTVSKISWGVKLGQEHLSAFDVFGSYVELAQPATRRVGYNTRY